MLTVVHNGKQNVKSLTQDRVVFCCFYRQVRMAEDFEKKATVSAGIIFMVSNAFT